MGFTAAKKLLRAIDNLWYVAAVEALCASHQGGLHAD